ncbi:TlpA family protein disulfide reductase [Novosphingobium bradum]|uniref:TlpA family protein disulfide reductase n=2 Tax=Novosphingobium bradum TaxID=1737444 RepID=A0ABV7IPL3_9SPHN
MGGCDRQGGADAQGGSSAATAPAAAEPAKGIDRSHKGSLAPTLVLADPAGRKLALASLAGKPFLVNLWATWCAPCVTELPTLEALALSGKLRVITVSQDSGEPGKVAQFLKAKGLAKLEPWLDPQNDLSFHYATGTLPTTVLYDSQGREVWRFVGEHDWSGAETATLLAEAR